VKSYEDLDVWQEAMALVEVAYGVSSSFPSDERFGLTSQLRRAVVSVPSNIAEGHARASTRDFLRFPSISMGSLAETRTQLLIA
jgi:four helix bundle protein